MPLLNSPDDKAEQRTLTAEELAQLQVLVSTDLNYLLQSSAESEVNYTEMIKRLNSSDTMAKGVEKKLDSILGTLDALLVSLGVDPNDVDSIADIDEDEAIDEMETVQTQQSTESKSA